MSAPVQLLNLANLERVNRSLTPILGLSAGLDQGCGRGRGAGQGPDAHALLRGRRHSELGRWRQFRIEG
jgi:hypothetical protein